MDFFIKKLFDSKVDPLVHIQFQKFSRGVFPDRALVKVRRSRNGLRINTTAEYANELVRYCAEKLGSSLAHVKGVIVSTHNLDDALEYDNKKQFMGIKQYVIDREMSGDQIITLCDTLPNAFFGLSFSVGETDLTIKAKAPKSSKPSTKSENSPKIDFCKVKTHDTDLFEKLVFDSEAHEGKIVEIRHDFVIDSIEVPAELKGENDFAKIREGALRKGTLVRKIESDGEKVEKKVEFEA